MKAPKTPSFEPRKPDPSLADSSGKTLFHPHVRSLESSRSRAGRSLPPDLQDQVTRRLRLVAIVYSLAFFFADWVSSLLMGVLPQKFQDPVEWVPSVTSILGGFLVAALVSSPRLTWEAKLNLGLVFEVLSCYGIALSQYLQLPELASFPIVYHVISPSWVAIWMMVFTIVVPAPPGRVLLALIASASAPPVVIWFVLQNAGLGYLLPPSHFFLVHVFPYAICVAMAYAAARVMYRLGAAVTRARELGSYRLTERLGSGGMGEVWRASHQLLAREAAIKFIRPEAIAGSDESATLLKRFELEARATASLSSAHTVNLYDFGMADDGTFYYVMELLDGFDCDRLVRRFGPQPPARVVHLLLQICESLEEAHDKGLIHRDVKPANIYVCRSGKRCDFVKVLDFGLVAHRQAPVVDLKLTRPEQAIGTPGFMPPEVALGRDIDGRTDLYGVGCVAYWLATGKPVFEGSGFYDVVSKHLHVAPDPPSRHVPGIPPALEALILRCLEKAPEKRPATARDLARLLRAVPLAEPWRDEHAELWWSENLAGPAFAVFDDPTLAMEDSSVAALRSTGPTVP